MDQGRLRLLFGSLLYILLAIGLIIFAVLTIKIATSVENIEDLEVLPPDKHKKDNLTVVLDDVSEHFEDDSKGLVTTVTLTTVSTTTTATTTTPIVTSTAEVPEYYILLNNNTDGASGKVYIDYYGRRGFVCSDGFDNRDASVVCREKGYKRGFSYTLLIPPGYERYTLDEPILTNLKCSGNENHLYECPDFNLDENVTESCTSFATVLCYDDIPYKFRFFNSLVPDSGQIQIYIDGQWGTFCAIQNFDNRVADLVCREMNYTRGIAIERGTGGPATRTPIWVPWISCDHHVKPKSLFECEVVLHTENIPFDYFTHWSNRYRNMYYACIDTNVPYAPAVHCFQD